MNRRAVLTSYLIVIASVATLLVPRLIRGYSSDPYFGGTIFLLDTVVTVLAVAGLILGPYFGLAGLIAKDKSVWVEANRLIHQHISVPFIAGLVLFYGSLFIFSFLIVLVAYILFVFLATLIGVMATRTAKPPTEPATSPP